MTTEKFTEQNVIDEAKRQYDGPLCLDTLAEAMSKQTLEEAVSLVIADSIYWNGPTNEGSECSEEDEVQELRRLAHGADTILAVAGVLEVPKDGGPSIAVDNTLAAIKRLYDERRHLADKCQKSYDLLNSCADEFDRLGKKAAAKLIRDALDGKVNNG